MKETVVTTKVVMRLNELAWCFAKKNHSGKFQSGDPDIMGCYDGRSFFIEMKMITGALTLIQASTLQKWRGADAITMMGIYDPKDKVLCLVSPKSEEQWAQYVGQESLLSAWKERHHLFTAEKLSDFDFEACLESFR